MGNLIQVFRNIWSNIIFFLGSKKDPNVIAQLDSITKNVVTQSEIFFNIIKTLMSIAKEDATPSKSKIEEYDAAEKQFKELLVKEEEKFITLMLHIYKNKSFPVEYSYEIYTTNEVLKFGFYYLSLYKSYVARFKPSLVDTILMNLPPSPMDPGLPPPPDKSNLN